MAELAESAKRAVGLARISMEERRKLSKGTTGHSIETQAYIIQSTGVGLGYTIVGELGIGYIVHLARPPDVGPKYPGVYYDDGGPGWAMGRKLRPGLYQLMEDAKKKKFEAVIVAYQDRLSRVSEDAKKLYRAFKALGVELVVEGRVIEDKDLMMLGVKAEVYEETIRNIRTKTKDAPEYAAFKNTLYKYDLNLPSHSDPRFLSEARSIIETEPEVREAFDRLMKKKQEITFSGPSAIRLLREWYRNPEAFAKKRGTHEAWPPEILVPWTLPLEWSIGTLGSEEE